jgi:SAM-dependent methyltransferase
MSFDAYERELWAGRESAYARGFARLTACTVEALLDGAGVKAGTRVLDVGTGPGIVAREAVRREAVVSAVDADPGMAAAASRAVPAASVSVGVLPSLPYPSASFDAVVGNFVINHVESPSAALAELRRVLRPGGRLALTCWRLPASGVMALLRDAMEEVGVPWPSSVPVTPFMSYGEPGAFAALVSEAFSKVVVTPLDWSFELSPESWWEDGAMSGVGSNAVVLSRQSPETIAAVKAAYDRLLASYASGPGMATVPAHALLATAYRD